MHFVNHAVILPFLECELCLPVTSSTHPYIFLISARNKFWFMSFFQPASIKNFNEMLPTHLWLMHHPNRLARASMNGVQQLQYMYCRTDQVHRKETLSDNTQTKTVHMHHGSTFYTTMHPYVMIATANQMGMRLPLIMQLFFCRLPHIDHVQMVWPLSLGESNS